MDINFQTFYINTVRCNSMERCLKTRYSTVSLVVVLKIKGNDPVVAFTIGFSQDETLIHDVSIREGVG
jgi:hypothetical protein